MSFRRACQACAGREEKTFRTCNISIRKVFSLSFEMTLLISFRLSNPAFKPEE